MASDAGTAAPTTPISTGELLVAFLETYGIDTVFGIPGNHTVQLYRGLGHSNIRHISPRHEQGAAFMADGYARATGRPAACFLISGPGLGNAITAIMQALADSVPMLVVTAVAARHQLAMGEGRLHELPDQRALASQCTRFSHTLMDPANLPRVLARAFAVFNSERPGPVHIEVPLDVITADASHVPRKTWPLPRPACVSVDGLAELATRLREARKPCLLVGGGAVKASAEVRALAERLAIPVVTTVNAKGILEPEHPLLVGGSPSIGSVRELLTSSDAVLAVGTEFGETDYNMLFLGELTGIPWLARIDIDAQQLARNVLPDLALVGDSRESLAALLPMLGDGPIDREAASARVADTRQRIAEEEHFHNDMNHLFRALSESLPDLCLIGDSTLPTYYAVWQYQASGPRRYFHSASGGGTLGYAIPAAIGARRALGTDVPVVCIIGDGSAQFTFMELGAAVQEGLPVIVLCWNNSGYREIRRGMESSGVTPTGVDIAPPDFLNAARALGCRACRATSMDELKAALVDAVAADAPTLIELREDDFLRTPGGNWY